MRKRDAWVLLGAAVLGGVAWLGPLDFARAQSNSQGADKTAGAASTVEVVNPQEDVVLLSETMKTSTPADLILAATAECSITTDVTTVGNDSQAATGTVSMWIEIDGKRVPVDSTAKDPGSVVFCNRVYQRDTSLFDDQNATIRTYMLTKAANGFNWLALNVGSGTHTVELHATLDTSASARSSAMAAVGNRTLIIEPIHAANNETVDNTTTTTSGGGASIIPSL